MAVVEHEQDLVTVYNPLNKPFEFKWGGVKRVIPAHTQATYQRYLAEHVVKHLADFILQVKEYQYKKQHGTDVNLLRNTKERKKVIGIIWRGVTQYFYPQDETGLAMAQKAANPSDIEVKKAFDIGDVEDDTVGVTMDSIEIETPIEARQVTVDSTKREITDQLDVLGIQYSDRETKPELLAKLSIFTDGDIASTTIDEDITSDPLTPPKPTPTGVSVVS